MPNHFKDRNKIICYMAQVGVTKYEIAKVFSKYAGWKKSHIYLVLRRDLPKYPLPSAYDLEKIREELFTLFGKKSENIIQEIKNDTENNVATENNGKTEGVLQDGLPVTPPNQEI